VPGEGGASAAAELGHLDALSEATIVTDADACVVFLNAAAEGLLGQRQELLVGRSLCDAVFSTADHDPVREISEQVLAGRRWNGQLEAVRADGSTVGVQVGCAGVRRSDVVTGLVCVLSELAGPRSRIATARRLADRLTGLARVAAELAMAETLEQVTDIVVNQVADVVGATVGSMSLLADPDTLVLGGIRGGREGVRERWQRYSVHDPTPAGDVVRSGERLVLVGRQAIDERYPHLERAAEGERSLIALPLRVTGRTIGVATWSFPGRRRIDVAELEFYSLLADTCAQAIERIRAEEESSHQAARVRFLADATSTMAESLDYEHTLAEVSRMVVPAFADWCAIDLLEDGRLQRLAVEHVDPEKIALAVDLERRYPAPPDAGGVWTVVQTGQALLFSEVTDEMVAASARNDEHRELLLRLRLRSVVLVPLIARGTVLGVMTWVMAESDRRYGDADLPFATDLGRRAAIAIDNSRLHTETLEAAVRLQRAVLPELPTGTPGWELASFYSPAGRTDVGGDFFDVVPLADDRLVMFVGDVMGRGVRAAAAMAQMRAAVRAYIAVEPDPRRVLHHLDALVETYHVSRLVTLVYLVADTLTGHTAVVNAGHPPPVILRASGGTEQLPTQNGAPLGIEPDRRDVLEFDLAPGDLVLAFTDGLIERRGEDIDVGQRRLLHALPALAGAALQQRLDAMVDGVRDHTRSDDVAALAVRRLTPSS
jgi:PAS domain S-box-containing protein